jgi:hypothetical protein
MASNESWFARGSRSVLLAALTAAGGCSTQAGLSSALDSEEDGLGPVGQVSSALVAPTCTEAQRQAAASGQEILLRALIDAANAYSANTNNPGAMEFFGARNEDQSLTVYYNLLWAYQTLMGDGQDFNIEYRCDAPEMCGPDDLAWSGTPNVTVVCDPNDPYFWQAHPYAMAHEMWHWLGWGDPNWLGEGTGDTAEAVHFYAQNDVATAIQMPHAYYLYLIDYIEPHFTEAIYNE